MEDQVKQLQDNGICAFNISSQADIIFTIIILTDLSKELEIQMNYWKEKQQEIESRFKNLYKPSQPSKVLKGSKSKKVDFSNKQLSCYAVSLTKEFLIKVRLIAFSYFTLQCSMLNCPHWTTFLSSF